MQYYTFTRTYQVPAQNFKAAQIVFSRALEERAEDQYYVGTRFGFPETPKHRGFTHQLVRLVPWVFEGVVEQLFGYTKQDKHFNRQ